MKSPKPSPKANLKNIVLSKTNYLKAILINCWKKFHNIYKHSSRGVFKPSMIFSFIPGTDKICKVSIKGWPGFLLFFWRK
jgi:hypothetical protein